jgi:hypothetical protein
MKEPVMPALSKEIAGLVFAVLAVGMYLFQRFLEEPSWFAAVTAAGFGIFAAAFTLLFCYIYGDAKRRNMNAALWTVLAIFAPSGIGIILYFLLREPIAACCTQCGTRVQAGFAFCPHCGANMATAACPQCHRIPQPGWSHCASCGAKL